MPERKSSKAFWGFDPPLFYSFPLSKPDRYPPTQPKPLPPIDFRLVTLDTFTSAFEEDFCGEIIEAADEQLHYEFKAALGSNCPAAYPDHDRYQFEYEEKIKLDIKRAPVGGGCG